jgi:hypothetical protein
MEFSWQLLTCPKCNKLYNWHIASIMSVIKARSGLGPSRIRCASCGTEFDSGLLEWTQMPVSRKIRYMLLTVIYSLFLGWAFTMPTMEIVGLTYYPADRNFPSAKFLLISVSVYAVLVICVQVLRVALSYSRADDELGQQPMEVSFWTWQTNPQGCGMSLTVLAIALYFFVAFGLR